MHILSTKKLRAGLVAVALVAGTIGYAGTAHALNQGLGVNKGCNSPTTVGQPYTCNYGILNISAINQTNNTITVTGITDVVNSAGGAVSSGNILSGLSIF